ncbi:precorrin-2 C(20)-methyltransferase [Azospirillum sp.]|uniref:precorrin-2 C(20)-methyltransferase n=1 Tax=Azospirillum sp. TaxID=34012 RepID=UPI003D751B22
MTGTLYGLGVGPGDPELVTLKALRLLRACPVIAYLAANGSDSFARSIVAGHLPGGQTELVVRIDMSAPASDGQAIYDRAAEEIAVHLAAGRDVAMPCEGDPFFYGSFQYLFTRLAGRFPVQVVPGVSSLMATAAAVPVPLTSRNDVLTVLPAPLDAAVLKERLAATDAAAVMKLGRHFDKVRAVVDELGLTARALYVERAGLPEQRVLPLAEVRPPVPYFSMILVPR